ncbi:hypothetical protein Cni_G05028 [Canna indica]|uniref:Uncharacterized protein n=1 Tax=Canna indica TaxID=4628 RepID=A0AAQ3JUG8_9LILI|nr:hypothetical protein Cni_G05028 [Canna indica]
MPVLTTQWNILCRKYYLPGLLLGIRNVLEAPVVSPVANIPCSNHPIFQSSFCVDASITSSSFQEATAHSQRVCSNVMCSRRLVTNCALWEVYLYKVASGRSLLLGEWASGTACTPKVHILPQSYFYIPKL